MSAPPIIFLDGPGGITAKKLNLKFASIGGGGTGTGDMTKAVYDTNNNGVVDQAESIPWSGISGKPTTFPPDGTAMLKSVYDTNGDGVSDHAALADTAPWAGISGKPATFPPDNTAMLKSVYDANGDNIVDQAAAVPWTGITGKPSTFPPDATAELVARKGVANGYPGLDATTKVPMAQLPAPASGNATTAQIVKGDDTRLGDARTPAAHASSHLDNGTDVIPVVTATRTGLTPKLSGNAGTYLDGTGVFSAPPGAVSPGTWTNLTYATGWSQSVTAQFRVETNGSFQTVICKGAILQAAGAANLAFTFPVGARPSAVRNLVLGGQQQADTVDVVLYHCNVDTTGAVTIYAVVKHSFVWAIEADAQLVYLDGLRFEL